MGISGHDPSTRARMQVVTGREEVVILEDKEEEDEAPDTNKVHAEQTRKRKIAQQPDALVTPIRSSPHAGEPPS